MEPSKIFAAKSLCIEQQESDLELRLVWSGRSNEREPGAFLLPILEGALTRSHAFGKPLILDFTTLEYMNSSTFTPLLRILEMARKGSWRIRLHYRGNVRWQSLSFSALRIFETPDGRVKLCEVTE